jgi:plasmid stabilization system protein ParE
VARREIDLAFEWYRVRSPGAADAFPTEIAFAIRRIREAPERYPVVQGRLRRRRLDRFPDGVYFKKFPTVVSVVGVIHGRRQPDTWMRRAAP